MKYKRHFSSTRCPLRGRGAELSPLDKGQAGPSVRFPPPALPTAHRTSRRRRAADPGAGSAGLWRGEESIRGEGAHSGPSAEPAAHLAQEAARPLAAGAATRLPQSWRGLRRPPASCESPVPSASGIAIRLTASVIAQMCKRLLKY